MTNEKPKKITLKKVLILFGFGILIILPISTSSLYILHVLIIALIYSLFAASWDFLSGYVGQISLGHAAYFGIGAYGAAILTFYYNVNPWIGLFLGAFLASVAGLVVSIPSMRLKGAYFAIVSLAFTETFRVIWLNWRDVTRGSLGIFGYQTFPGTPYPASYLTKIWYYYIALTIVLTSISIMWWLAERTETGLKFKAIREDEILAEAHGIDTTRHKTLASIISAFFTGLAGSFYAYYVLVVTPTISASWTGAAIIAYALVGGKATIFGSIVGSIIMVLLREQLRGLGLVWDLLVVGLSIIIIILFFPQGIVGSIKKILEKRIKK